MPPDRGAVKKSSYATKQQSSTPQKKRDKDDVKDVHSKLESGRDKGTNKSRESSGSVTSKEKSQRQDQKARSSVSERLELLKRETEKARVPSSNVKQVRVRPKEPRSTSRVTEERSNRNIEPASTPSRTPGRNPSQLSRHATRTAEKPNVTSSSKGGVKKYAVPSVDSNLRRAESRRQGPTQKEIRRTEKLPDKLQHPEGKELNRHSSRQAGKIDEPKRLSRDRTRTRTLSPREVRVTRGDPDGTGVQSERQKEIAQNVAVVSAAASIAEGAGGTDEQLRDNDGDYEYEDDFEDYESDFEDSASEDMSDEGADIGNDDDDSNNVDDSESELVELTPRQQPFPEEEKKLDSGNYDLAERRRKSRELQEIKMALDRENEAMSAQEKTYRTLEHHVVPRDEGYEEGKMDDNRKFSSAVMHLNFINFANARKRKQGKKATASARKRGDELLGMIRLDIVNFTLLELAPVPYEVYMKTYGCSNTLQAHAQTNEDDLCEEVQTDEISCKNKWTQRPVSFQTRNDGRSSVDEVTVFSQDHFGVGGDSVDDDPESWRERLKVDTVRLSQFLSSAGQVISVLLEEREMRSANKLNRNLMDVPFSDGYLSLGVQSVPFLADRPVTIIRFPHCNSSLLLTVHNNTALEDRKTEENLSLCRSMIAIWSIREPSVPQKILMAVHEITASCFGPVVANMVFAGHVDGSLCIWDLREKSHCHQKVETEHGEWVLRSPTYNTAEILKDKGHLSKIVALQPFGGTEMESNTSGNIEHSPTQICSLDEEGTIIVWTVIQSYKQGHQNVLSFGDLGLAHWGRVHLVWSSTISLDHHLGFNLTCFDLQLDSHDNNHLYVGTNVGRVAHCLKSGGKPAPQFYTPKGEEFMAVTCIEACPFMAPYFLIGCEVGTVQLYAQASQQPIVTLAGTGDPFGEGPPIVSLQWSHSKLFIFFVLDSMSRIHIWDLSKSDIYPVYTVPFGTVSTMQLSPDVGDVKTPPHLVLATGPGRVEIHQLKPEYYNQSPDDIGTELDKLLHCTSML